MTLLSLLCVLVLEQLKALPPGRVNAALADYAAFLERHFNGGELRHGTIAWLVGVAVPALLVFVVHLALAYLNGLLALAFDVAVLYFLLGFRQFSHAFTELQLALRMGELERARRLLADWRGRSADRLDSRTIALLGIEQGILASYSHVFAPLLWFLLLGPAGALLYRCSLAVDAQWGQAGATVDGPAPFAAFAHRARQVLDWLPTRLTAATFAIVGDFEDAVYCWRTQAAQWPDPSSGILLASAAGALGIRLGQPLPDELGIELRPELGLGEDADVEHLQSAIGLVWRALVLCLLMLALLSLASWLG